MEEKKSWIRRHPIISVFFILIGAIIFVAIIGSIVLQGSQTAQKTASKEEYICPELSSMQLEGYDKFFQTWIAYPVDYVRPNEKMVYSNLVPPQEGFRNRTVIYCDTGSQEGQNPNYVYCGDQLRPINLLYLDAQGNIKKKVGVQVTFDSATKKYIATKCDVYPTY